MRDTLSCHIRGDITVGEEEVELERLLQLAYSSQPISAETIGAVYGSTLPILASEWATWARAERDSVPDIDAKIAEYRNSPIQYIPHCETIASRQ